MKLSEFSVKNSLVINAFSIFIVILGIASLSRLEREAFPNFSFDIVTIRTVYPGASPDVVEKRITLPLEEEVRKVDDLDEVASVSLEGMSLLIVKIDPDADDKNRVVNEIERAVQEVQDLPEDLEDRPLVKEMETKDTPIVEVSLSGPLPEKDLREWAQNLETELLDFKGVSSVELTGMRDPEIWVEVDPIKMGALEISLSQVMEALAAQNVNVPGGLLKGENDEIILRTTGELETAQDVEDVIIRGNDVGNWVKVRDIGRVSDRFEEQKVIQRTDGSRSINLLIIKEDKADAIRLTEGLKEYLAEFQKRGPPELKIALVNDFSYYIKRRLNVLVSNGWMGLILVIVPMIFFLNFRTAIGAAMGMPIAILTAFAAMDFFGISINLISMFGMIIVLGMLVDEDVVIAENIARYMEEGMSAAEAAIKGAKELMGAIISVVATTILAFVPLLFMTGIMGKFCSDIPKVVIITLGASLLEALIILPSHLADLNKQRREGAPSFKKRTQHHYMDRVRVWYGRTLRVCLNRPVLTSVLSLLIMFAAFVVGAKLIPFILFPKKGIEAFFIRADAPIGTRLERMEELMQPLEKLVAGLSTEELDHYVTQVGIQQQDPTDPFTSRGSHLAQIQVFLTPETGRDRDADMIMESLRSHLGKVDGFKDIRFDSINPGPPVGKPVAVKIRGDEYSVLEKVAEEYKRELKTMKGVKDIRDDYEEGKEELRIDVDRAVATQSGLTYQDIAFTVRQAFEGVPATIIRKADEEIDVVVRLPESARYDETNLKDLMILNRFGNLVPLEKVARLVRKPSVSEIKHDDGKRAITVTANIDEQMTTATKLNDALKEKFANVVKEYPGYTIKYGGEDEDTQESMQSLFRALIAALLLIFLVLLITFGSLLETFVLMLTIPFGFVGVVIGFGLLNEPFTFLALLGVVGLTGVVIDGGTLLFVFINNLRDEGMHLKDAIIKACEVRMRPIFLTTITTILGVLPAAYGIGGSDPFIQPMALAMNWGIAFSVIFTMYSIPCIYYVLDRAVIRLQHRLKLKVAHDE